MRGIFIDLNIEGHFNRLLLLLQAPSRRELWDHLRLSIHSFKELRLQRTTTDRVVWERCQAEEWLLFTANRNALGEESLEVTIRELATSASLPAITLGDPRRFLSDRAYAERAADRFLEYLFDMDEHRGAGRLYIP